MSFEYTPTPQEVHLDRISSGIQLLGFKQYGSSPYEALVCPGCACVIINVPIHINACLGFDEAKKVAFNRDRDLAKLKILQYLEQPPDSEPADRKVVFDACSPFNYLAIQTALGQLMAENKVVVQHGLREYDDATISLAQPDPVPEPSPA